MTEHGKFKEIIDLIGYNNNLKLIGLDLYKNGEWNSGRNADVREIIFTPEFKDKLFNYLDSHAAISQIQIDIWDNLDDLVSYLYNTLGLGTKK